MRQTLQWLATSLVAVSMAATAGAQSRPIELGIDAGLSIMSAEGSSITTVSLPTQQFRVGFFFNDKLSFEPTLALAYYKPDEGDSFTQYDIGAGLLYHFTTERTAPQFFVRPLVGYTGSSGGDESSGAPYVGAGVGVKFHRANRLAFRIGADYARKFKDDPTPAMNNFALTFGLSFFTK